MPQNQNYSPAKTDNNARYFLLRNVQFKKIVADNERPQRRKRIDNAVYRTAAFGHAKGKQKRRCPAAENTHLQQGKIFFDVSVSSVVVSALGFT